MFSSQTLSIIILAYNEESYIGSCLEAIKQQTVPPNEVIVVNNNSNDKTLEIIQSYPFVTLITETEQGMIPARDSGFNAAKSDFLARIDADTRIPPHWVATVHTVVATHRNEIFGVSGPQYFYAIKNEIIRRIVSRVTSYYGFFGVSKLLLGHHTLFGSNMIISKEAWQKIKNEVCHDGQEVHEDIDLALHIGMYGSIIFDSRLIVGISSRALFEGSKKHFWRLKTWIRTITKHRNLFVGPHKSRI